MPSLLPYYHLGFMNLVHSDFCMTLVRKELEHPQILLLFPDIYHSMCSLLKHKPDEKQLLTFWDSTLAFIFCLSIYSFFHYLFL